MLLVHPVNPKTMNSALTKESQNNKTGKIAVRFRHQDVQFVQCPATLPAMVVGLLSQSAIVLDLGTSLQ
jgi:hypothetical protein